MFKLNVRQKKKMAGLLGIVLCASLMVLLILKGLNTNLNLFLTPEEVVQKNVPLQKKFRLGGMVVPGSVRQEPGKNLRTHFKLTDFKETIGVDYEGLLPDLFREGQGIVAEGYLSAERQFKAKNVLAKHDEKYMPPNLKNIPQGNFFENKEHGIAS